MTVDTDGGGLRKRRRRYTNMPSTTISDPDISFKALGVLLFSLDKPDGWVFRADAIARERNRDGRDSVSSAYRELAQRGYYRVERRRMLDGTFKMGNAISEEPVEEWAREYEEYDGKPIPLIQQRDGSFRVKRKDGTLASDGFDGEFSQVTPVTGFPEPAQPGPVNPGSGGTEPGEPGAITNKDNPLPKPNPSGSAPLRSAPPEGGRASAAPAPDSDADDALFDVAEPDLSGNDLRHRAAGTDRAGGAAPGGRKPRGGGRAKKRAAPFPEDWRPSPAALEKAKAKCPLLDEERLLLEADRCAFWANSNGRTYVQHDQMWLNWVLGEQAKAAKGQSRGQGGARPGRQGSSYGGAELYRDADTWGTEERDVSSWDAFNTRPMDDAPMTEQEREEARQNGLRRAAELRDERARKLREARRSQWDPSSWTNPTTQEAG